MPLGQGFSGKKIEIHSFLLQTSKTILKWLRNILYIIQELDASFSATPCGLPSASRVPSAMAVASHAQPLLPPPATPQPCLMPATTDQLCYRKSDRFAGDCCCASSGLIIMPDSSPLIVPVISVGICVTVCGNSLFFDTGHKDKDISIHSNSGCAYTLIQLVLLLVSTHMHCIYYQCTSPCL